MQDLYQFVFFSGKKIAFFTLNFRNPKNLVHLKEYQQIIEVENDQKYKIIFHPFLYHYAIVTQTKIQVASFLFDSMLFSVDWGVKNLEVGMIGINKVNHNLMIGQNEKIIEIKIEKERENSWVYLVNIE